MMMRILNNDNSNNFRANLVINIWDILGNNCWTDFNDSRRKRQAKNNMAGYYGFPAICNLFYSCYPFIREIIIS